MGEIHWQAAQREGEDQLMHCPHCHGQGCNDCNDSGTYELPCDPIEFAFDVWPLIRIADVWRKGTPPEAGGMLDQPAGLTDAVRFIWADEDHLKADRLGQMAFFM